MKQTYKKISAALLTFLIAVFFVSAQSAHAADKSAQQVVEEVTKELFATVKSRNAGVKKTDAYYADVQATLEKVVDFPFIAKAVMRKSAKTATPEQVEKFTEVFKNGLIKTYAKGIANYADSEVKTLPVTGGTDKRVSVEQEVTDKGNTHRLSYTMALTKTGEWKLINVVLNGVNLGESFTSQFDQAMIKNGNDVDKVIATWLAAS